MNERPVVPGINSVPHTTTITADVHPDRLRTVTDEHLAALRRLSSGPDYA
jgi:hypothetical protein